MTRRDQLALDRAETNRQRDKMTANRRRDAFDDEIGLGLAETDGLTAEGRQSVGRRADGDRLG